MIIDQLLCIYNYIPVSHPPLIQINLELVQNYPPIEKMLKRLCFEERQENETLENIYFLLNQFIMKEQQTLGPKRFSQLITNIFTILTQYMLNLIRQNKDNTQQLFFHLTYYKKNCGKYVNHFYEACILVFYIICNFNMKQFKSVDEKIVQCRKLTKIMLKQKNYDKQIQIFERLSTLYESHSTFRQGNLKKAKDLCSKIISRASLELTECIKLKRQASSIVKLQLLLASMTVMRIYQQQGKHDLYTFIINKCIQYSEKFLDDNFELLKYLQVDKMHLKQVTVKLTRLEQKIRRIELAQEEEIKKAQQQKKLKSKTIFKNNTIYNNEQFSKATTKIEVDKPRLSNITNKLVFPSKAKEQSAFLAKSRTFHYATLRSASTHSLLNPPQPLSKAPLQKQNKKLKDDQSQLQNLLIIKDKKKNYFRLKEQTLKYLNKQNNQLKRLIKVKARQIQQISRVKQQVVGEYDVSRLKQKIQKCQHEENLLINSIENDKWKHLQSLPAIRKINTYMKTFIQDKYFWHSKNVYSLVYGQMLSLSQMKLISVLRRKAHKQTKDVINQLVYNNIKHQVEYIRQTKDNNEIVYFMNIYQTEKGHGINEQVQITEDQWKVVRYEPFFYYFSYFRGKVVSFERHVMDLSLRETYYVRKFIWVMSRFNPVKGLKSFKKVHFYFNYKDGSYIIGEKPQKQSVSDSQANQQKRKILNIQKNGIPAIFFITIHELPDPNRILQKVSLKKNKESLKQQQRIEEEQQKDCSKDSQSQSQCSQVSISSKTKNTKQIQLTIQKVSAKNIYQNPLYNFSLLTKIRLEYQDFQQKTILEKVMTQKLNQIFEQKQKQIILMQRHLKRRIAYHKFCRLKENFHVQTRMIKNILYTLVVNKQTQETVFFIEKIEINSSQTQRQMLNSSRSKSVFASEMFTNSDRQSYRSRNQFSLKNYSFFVKKDVGFKELEFLSKMEGRLDQIQDLKDQYKRIEKYLKIKHFAEKIFCKSKNIRFFTDFQTQFKKKLCFAVIKPQFLYKGKMREGKIMYMLTVKQFSKIPRPYLLRIFTLDPNSMTEIVAQKTIYNKQKLFLQSKLATINEVIEIFSRNDFEIFAKQKAPPMKKVSSRISILSNYSFQSGESCKDYGDDKGHGNNVFNRRMSKNSMFAKFRHKALIKNQDLEAIKKLVQERNLTKEHESTSSEHSSKNSIVSPVMSQSSEEKQSQDQ